MSANRLLRAFSLVVGALCLVSAGARGETAAALIAKGDACDRRLQTADALKSYLPAEKLDPNNAAILVRIARQYRHSMSDTSDKKEKLRLGRLSLEYAERAATLAPDNADAQLSAAISYGKMLPYMGSGEQAAASPRIKKAVDRTLQLDPKNDTAWHILGRWNRVLADMGGVKRALAGAIYGKLPVTSNEEAEKCLLKAIALNSNRLMHDIELGRIYAQMGRKDDARKFIQKALSMPDKEKDDPELKALGRELLKKLG